MALNTIHIEPPCRPMKPTVRASAGSNEVDDTRSVARRFATEHRHLAAGQELVSESDMPDHLFVVLDGWMMLRRILEDGRQQILDFALPGAVLGNPTGADGYLHYSVEALTEASVAAISLGRIPALIAEAPFFAITMLRSVHAALDNAYESLTDTGRRTAREAVASFLLRMETRIRTARGTRPDGRVEFPLTQENIGDSIGLTAVHVCRTLRALKAEGLIEVGRGSLVVRNRKALADIAGLIGEEDGLAVATADWRVAV